MPYIDPSVLASTIENAQCKAGELSDKYINSVNSGEGCDCALAELRMLIFTIKALECCSSQSSCGTTIEETFRMMESTMIDCAAPTCTASVSSPTFPPLPLPLISSLINVEEYGSLVGSFGTLNFIGVGQTTIDVTNAGGGVADIEIITGGAEKTWFADALSKAAGGTLVTDRLYWIVDVGDGEGSNGGFKAECSAAYYNFGAGFQSYAHNAGIMLRAVSATQFDPNGVYLARVPKTTMQWFIPGTSYGATSSAVSYNQVFTTTPGVVNAQVEPAEDTSNWTYRERDNNTYYDTEIQGCIFDVSTATSNYGIVRERWDARGNRLTNMNTATTANEFIKKVFRWGVSTIAGNTINFWDDSTRRLSADSMRSPSFNDHLINYGNVQQMRDNRIDTDMASTDTSSNKRGTRFWNMYWLSNANFQGNKLDNAVVSNITWDSGAGVGYQFINNTVKDSVINNVNFLTFANNTLLNNTVVGDIFYDNTGVSNSSAVCLFKMDFVNLPNKAIINNLGSKNWSASGDATSTLTPGVGITTVVLNGSSGTTNADNNDIFEFKVCAPDATLVGQFKPVTVVAGNSFTVQGVFASGTGLISGTFYYPSIKTSFQNFNGNNIYNSIVRGLNKETATGCHFTENKIEYSYIENYNQHTAVVANVFPSGNFYSNPGNEFGRANDANRGFARNNIKYSVFANNKISNTAGAAFYSNTIENASFYLNKNTGLEGVFSSNTIKGYEGQSPINPNTPYFDVNLGYNNIRFTNNSFQLGSIFNENNIQNYTTFSGVSLASGANVASNQFVAYPYEYVSSETSAYNSYVPGWFDVAVEANVSFRNSRFTGNKAAFRNLTLTTTGTSKQLSNFSVAGYAASKFFENIYVDNFTIDSTNKSATYEKVYPQLFDGNNLSIRNITWVKDPAGPFAQVIGANTYQIARFTLTITTQNPHFFTPDFVAGGATLTIGLSGLNMWVVGLVPAVYPNGGVFNYTQSNLLFTQAAITNIIDEYTFEVYLTGLTLLGYFFLDVSNTQAGQNGVLNTNDGLYGTYSDSLDIYGFVSLINFWYKDYNKIKGNTITTNNFARISAGSFDPVLRVPMSNSCYPPPATPAPASESRDYQSYVNWVGAPVTRLYDPTGGVGDRRINLPHFFDVFGSTVLLGDSTGGTYDVDKIFFMPDMVPVRFVVTPGCDVTFNLVSAAAPAANRIIQDSAATSYTLRAYMGAGSAGANYWYDELVLMRQGTYIKIISKIIHS